MAKPVRIIFHIFLMLTILGMSLAVLYFTLLKNDFLVDSPGIEPYFSYYVGSALMTIAGAVALLKDYKWGIWCMAAGFATAFIVEILADLPWEKIMRIPIATIVLFWLSAKHPYKTRS